MNQQKIINCPFCDKRDVRVLYIEASYKESIAYAAGNRRIIPKLIPAREEVLSDCPSCGKTAKEIQKRLKEGKPIDKNNLIERLKAMGIDPSKGFVQKRAKGKFD